MQWLAVNWPWMAGAAVMLAAAIGAHVQRRGQIALARGSRWATWLDEPRDRWGGEGDD